MAVNNSCHVCKGALVQEYDGREHMHDLVRSKDNGGLVYPSKGLVSVLNKAETAIRGSQSVSTTSYRISPLYLKVKVMSSQNTASVLGLESHALETVDGISNNHDKLLTFIMHQFYNIRLQHIIRLQNADLHADYIRQRNNRLVLFSGQ